MRFALYVLPGISACKSFNKRLMHTGEVLVALLRRLLDEKLLVDEMNPLDKHDKGKDSATFLGVAQPGGPGTVYRRIDFKVCALRPWL